MIEIIAKSHWVDSNDELESSQSKAKQEPSQSYDNIAVLYLTLERTFSQSSPQLSHCELWRKASRSNPQNFFIFSRTLTQRCQSPLL